MPAQVKLKLVGADRYACPLIGEDVIEKGQTFYVSEASADELLKEKKFDALNNEHDIFLVVGEDAEEDEAGDGEEAAKPQQKAARSAPRTAKK